MRFLCGNDAVAVAMHVAMKNGKFRFSLRKFLAISPAIQKIASDSGCDAAVHLGGEGGGLSIFWEAEIPIELFKCNQSTSKQGRDKTRAVKRKPCTNL